MVEDYDETTGSLLDRILRQLGTVEYSTPQDTTAWTPPYGEFAWDLRKSVLAITQEIIRNQAATGQGVIVGRGGAYVLRDEADVLKVFLVASESFRVRETMKSLVLTEAEARKRLKQIDANRAAYAKQVYGNDWGRLGHHDLVLNTDRLGYARAADAIIAALPGAAERSG